MRDITTCSRPSPRPASTILRLAITAWVWATMPSGNRPGVSGRSGICPVTKTKPSVSTAWLNGATGFGPPAIMWNFNGGSLYFYLSMISGQTLRVCPEENRLPLFRIMLWLCSRDVFEQALAQDGMNAPIAIYHLGHAKVYRRRHQRDRLVFAQSFDAHQEAAHLAERVLHREIERGRRVDFALPLGAELGEISRLTEAG